MEKEMKMHTETAAMMQCVYAGCVPCEQTAELQLQEDLPNIREILFADGIPLLRGKEVEKGKLLLRGIVHFCLIYSTDEECRFAKSEADIPFSCEIGCPGADESCSLICSLRLSACSAKLLGSRKYLARTEILLGADCRREVSAVISCYPEDPDGILELKKLTCRRMLPSSFSEKSFVITDSFRIPDRSDPISELLCQSVRLQIDDIKPVGTKLILKGTVFTDVLYRTGDSPIPRKTDFSSEFSQIIETESVVPEGGAEVTPALTGAFFHTEATLSPDERQIIQEIHVAAQCITYTEVHISCITDVYSPRYAVAFDTQHQTVPGKPKLSVHSIPVKNISGCQNAGTVLFAAARSAAPETAFGDGAGKISFLCDAAALCAAEDGTLFGTAHRFRAEGELPVTGTDTRVAYVQTGDVNTEITPEGVEFRFPAEIGTCPDPDLEADFICAIRTDPELVLDLSGEPSVIVHRYRQGDSLWSLSKQYHSSAPQICEANGVDGEGEFAAGKLIIIPKIR